MKMILLAAGLALASTAVSAQVPPGIEEELFKTIPIGKVLPSQDFTGEGFTLGETVNVYRSVAIFDMETRYGPASIVGREGLAERVRELQAIDTLEAMKTSEVYRCPQELSLRPC